jgi:hypothetical protein
MKKNKRPWQSVAIIILYMVITVAVGYTAVINIAKYTLAFIVLQDPNRGAQFMSALPNMVATPLVMVSFLTFVLTSILYGKKIGLIMAGVIQTFLFLSGAINLIKLLVAGDFNIFILQFIGMFILAGILWLIWQCLKHPFYGGDGKLSVDTFKFWKKRKIVNSDDMTTF